jgi:hypothetical protein
MPGTTPRPSCDPGFGGTIPGKRERHTLPGAGPGSSRITDALLQRVCGEFLEMPGLRLTSQQARRLWGLDEPTCREVLDFLVEAKFLAGPGRGSAYSRLSDGSVQPPRLRGGGTAVTVASPDRLEGTA